MSLERSHGPVVRDDVDHGILIAGKISVGMVAIEDKLGVVINEQELLTCDTVGDLERVIRSKVAVAP